MEINPEGLLRNLAAIPEDEFGGPDFARPMQLRSGGWTAKRLDDCVERQAIRRGSDAVANQL